MIEKFERLEKKVDNLETRLEQVEELLKDKLEEMKKIHLKKKKK